MTHEISCKELVDLVTDYLEEALSEEARVKFEQHLSECGYCTAYFKQMQTTITLTGKLAEDNLSLPARDELLNVFRNWKQRKE